MTDSRTPDRDVNRTIRSWLREDRHEDVSRIAGAVLDQLDTTPQRRATLWPARRTPTMNKIIVIGLGAAAVVVALFVGAQLFASPGTNVGGPGDEPTPSATAEPTPEPTLGGLPVGPHMILDGHDDGGAVIMPPLTVTIPAAGWSGEVGEGILSKNEDSPPPDFMGMIVFTQPEYIVFGDACRWETTPNTTVTTVDEFVAALASQGSRTASEPVDIALDGYAGKSITLEVPDDVDVADCDPGYAGSWDCGGGGTVPCGYHGGPDAIDVVYILDVDGLIMAWETWHYTGTSAEDVAELEAVVLSASFGE
jgi:hypothetical protein